MEIDSPSKREDRQVKKPLSSSDVSDMVKYLCKFLSKITYKYEQYQLKPDTEAKRDFVIRYEAMVETLWNLYMTYGPPLTVTVEKNTVSYADPEQKKLMWNKMMRQETFTPNRQNWTRLCTEMEQYFYFFELMPPEITSNILDYLRPMSDDTKALSQIRAHLKDIISAREVWIPYCINLMCNITVALVELGRVDMMFGGGSLGGWISVQFEKASRHEEEEEYQVAFEFTTYADQEEISGKDLIDILEKAIDHLGPGGRGIPNEGVLWENVKSDKVISMIRLLCESAVTLGRPWSGYFMGIVSRSKYVHTAHDLQVKKYLTRQFEEFFTLKGHTFNPNLMENGLMPYKSVTVKYSDDEDLKRPNESMRQCTVISLDSLKRETLSESGKRLWARTYNIDPQTMHEKILFNTSLGWYNPDTSFVCRRIRESKKNINSVLIGTYIVIDCYALKTLQFLPGFGAVKDASLPLGIIPEWKYLAYIQNPIRFILAMENPPEFIKED
jgi:hypothetical protein